ncbi:Eukaryotic translation initiation factor 5 [Schistosoma japonicum]|nr:Eukaryotic translation initiation factor 5 [Schistosoma japonicum]KAH8859018.1 Eukaryotic translation initiation factor 5 [Schistosoma japonicum]
MAININREVEDTFYRYKMPKLAAKVEGKGNGIKTVIVNVSDIAKALYRKPIYLTKFFGCELGAQIHVDEKNERYIVNGAHQADKLQELLDGFIKKFVLCQSCGNPETTMHVNKKGGTVTTICKACGSQGQLDVTHRLTQYIVKNPPEPEATPAKSKQKKGKKSKGENEDDDNDAATNGDEGSRISPVNTDEVDDDEDWLEDTTEEARRQRINALSAMAKSLALCDDVERSENDRADIFYKHLLQIHQSDKVLSSRKDIRLEADRLNLGPRAVLVVAEVLFNNPSTILADIRKYSPLLLLFTRSGEDQKRAQIYTWGAMAKLIERYSDHDLLSKACHILKTLYDCDIVEEDVILGWYDRGPSKKFVSRELSTKILARCAPMVTWLRQAEEEESESSEGESENNSPKTNHLLMAQMVQRLLTPTEQVMMMTMWTLTLYELFTRRV